MENSLTSLHRRGLCNTFAILATLKNLIDIDIDIDTLSISNLVIGEVITEQCC